MMGQGVTWSDPGHDNAVIEESKQIFGSWGPDQ
jgi:hypothetical protein